MVTSAKRILIVDDDEDMLLLYSSMVERAGAAAESAKSGQESVERVRDRAPDLILLDMRMPLMDGVEVAKQLRAIGFTGPIIAMTAGASLTGKTGKRQSQEAGINKYLSKAALTEKVLEALLDEYCE